MERDESYDFIKGIAILAVIIYHSLTFTGLANKNEIQYTLGHAVPIFLTITIYLYFKKFGRNIDSNINFRRLFKNLIFPFFISQLITIPIALKYGISYKSIIETFGCGAGTYYILVYLQTIYLSKTEFRLGQYNWKFCGVVLLIFHLLSEIIFTYIQLPEYIYRLLCTRYLFLFFIAYLLYRKDILYKFRHVIALCVIGGLILQYINCECANHLGLYPSLGFPSQKFYTNFITLVIIITIKALYPYFRFKPIIKIGRYSNYLFIIQLTFFPAMLYLIDILL